MNFFVSARAKTLFMLMYVAPTVVALAGIYSNRWVVAGYAMAYTMVLQIVWLWQVAVLLRRLQPALASRRMGVLNILCAVLLLAVLAMVAYMPTYFEEMLVWPLMLLLGFPWSVIMLLGDTNILWLIMIGYLVEAAIVSRLLRAVELQHPVDQGVGYNYMLTMFFSPMGIWFIQPRINRLHQGKTIDDL